MKGLALLIGACSLFAAQELQFRVIDERGKETSAVSLEAGSPDEDGWQPVRIAKSKGPAQLIWPWMQVAKVPDGPEPVPAIVIRKGDAKALANQAVIAALAVPVVLQSANIDDVAQQSGLTSDALRNAFDGLSKSSDPFQKGVGFLYSGKPAEAAEQLAIALRQRQRQLTRVPSEIYPAALIDGLALLHAGKYDDAAVAFLAAQKQKPSSELAARWRKEALVKAGKAEAADQ